MIGIKKAHGNGIGDEKLAKLRELYLAGTTMKAAAAAVSVSVSTVFKKFRAFRRQGLVGGIVARQAGRRSAPLLLNRKYPASWDLPRYVGPTWIGKRIDTESRI